MDLDIKVDTANAWRRAFNEGRTPPLPASWHSGSCRASCTCPDFLNGPRTSSWWCKHIISAFYVIASECDKDPKFVYKLSGHDFEAEFEEAWAARVHKRIRIDLTGDGGEAEQCGGCSQDPWVVE